MLLFICFHVSDIWTLTCAGTILNLSPRRSHKFRSLDLSVIGHFKTAYNKSVDTWMQTQGTSLSYTRFLNVSVNHLSHCVQGVVHSETNYI